MSVARRASLVLATPVAVGLVWVLFRYVVEDAGLVLDYLRVLVWPLVAVAVLSFFRNPVEEKVRQLLRLDAFGASAQFSPEAQGRRLARDLDGDLQDLFEVIDADVSEGQSAVDADQGEDAEDVPQDALAPTEEAGSRESITSTTAPDDDATTAASSERPAVDLDDYFEIARVLGVPLAIRYDFRERVLKGEKGAFEGLKAHIESEAQRARSVRNQAMHRQEETRERIEAVIRTSAAWGYEMGRAGAPEAVPDIAWNKDGTWRITTEVPKATAAPKRAPAPRIEYYDDMREVRELVKEIKEIERKRHGGPGALGGLLAFQDDGWLKELKRRLAMVDPRNPWAR
jgi:hypothetical protein